MKKSNLLVILITSIFMLSACSESDETASSQDTKSAAPEISIYQLASDAGYAFEQIKRDGSDHSAIQTLMDGAYEAMKVGDMDKARDLLNQAIKKSHAATKSS